MAHPERPARLTSLLAELERSGLAADVDRIEAPPAPLERLLAVHDEGHVRAMRAAVERGARLLDQGDTAISTHSWRAALCAAGAGLEAAERILSGEWRNAFAAVRPPGHHAEHAQAMGFCLLNNVAVCARALREVHGIERVAIIDWDVHHGNGTQHAFEHDPSVFFLSLHQWPHYPGSGAADEHGSGEGEGTTRNLPLPAGSGDREWLAALEEGLREVESFAPEFILVSAGFDAHAADPLSGTCVTTAAYARMTEAVGALAQRCAQGRLLSMLEGGYDLAALASSAAAHLAALRGV
ncbi:MAG: histone deacetylase [Planctomycetes bacterium]|jgi:acetoin utilization deacetylase AcuC-like enzyme|nr:histone deacetylase [Planctomycetota bacterium]